VSGRLLRLREVVVRSGGRPEEGAEVCGGLGAAGHALSLLSDMQGSLSAAVEVRRRHALIAEIAVVTVDARCRWSAFMFGGAV
jgi:hypothetical protein